MAGGRYFPALDLMKSMILSKLRSRIRSEFRGNVFSALESRAVGLDGVVVQDLAL